MKTETQNGMPEFLGTATYSPEDNKLRLLCYARLSKEDYNRARSAGFIWAPKQEIFVAPMWTPDREDLLLEWCGEIGDEDKSLVERAEERADRFSDYSDKRKQDADNAHKTVESICEHIPLGQPILVGHHSERRARKDAERIENGMKKAVRMWETSKYWQERAKGAISHAKYKERPDVRARRIKTLEASKRKQERNKAEAEKALRFWRGQFKLTNKQTGEKKPFEIIESNREKICAFLGGIDYGCGEFHVVKKEGDSYCGGWSPWDVLQPDEKRYKACPSCTVEQCREAAERSFSPRVEHYQRWINHYENRLTYERAMLAEDGGTATDRKGPEKGGGCKCWASRNHHAYIQKVNKVSVTILDNWGNGGGNFTRTIPFDKLYDLVSLAEVNQARAEGRLKDTADGTGFVMLDEAPEPKAPIQPKLEPTKFDEMRETLKAGVQVVSAPQLFPTPPDLARAMVEAAFENGWGVQVCAEMNERCRVLEPSAGTGNILAAIQEAAKQERSTLYDCIAVEINQQLAHALLVKYGENIKCADFLSLNGELGKFDRIVMNPPFENGSDIKHIEHARHMLNPGGRLVAICANGPRQQEKLKPLASSWTDLPQGTFKEQGTNVNTAMLIIDAP